MLTQDIALVIPYYIKSIYGSDKAYIADADLARKVTRLTGRTTLTPTDYAALEDLGFTFTQVLPPR